MPRMDVSAFLRKPTNGLWRAHGIAVWCYAWRKIIGWMTDRTRELAEN